MKSNHSHPQNHTLILHQNVKAKIRLTMTKKSVLFNVPKEFNINDERVSVDELDSQINPYLHNDKHQHDPDDVAALPSPKELPQITAEPKRVRVGRPLRHVKHKPTKEVTYINNQIFPKFSYEKIKFPLKPNTLIVHVKYFAVNPIDLKIWNYYTSDLTGAKKGFGREYSGEVYQVSEEGDQAAAFEEGDAVTGLYYHLFNKGCSASHILIDLNKDPIVRVDDVSLSLFGYQKLGGWAYNFATAFQVLNSITAGGLNSESTVLVNGGSTGTGLMTIQILKHYFHVSNIVAICSGTASDLVTQCGASVVIDYKKEFDLIKSISTLLTNGKKTIIDRHGNEVEVLYPDKKFDIIVDYLGGTTLLEAHQQILNDRNGTYLTTVGDKRANYRSKEFVYGSGTVVGGGYGRGALLMFGGPRINYKMVNFDGSNVKNLNNLLKIGLEMIRQSQLQVKVNSVFKMTEIKKALDKLKTQHALGKVLVEVEDF